MFEFAPFQRFFEAAIKEIFAFENCLFDRLQGACRENLQTESDSFERLLLAIDKRRNLHKTKRNFQSKPDCSESKNEKSRGAIVRAVVAATKF